MKPPAASTTSSNGDARDGSIRPNQIFAVSLFHSHAAGRPGAARRRRRRAASAHAVRPAHPRARRSAYRGRYEGDPVSRDSAYHQGTVWPWLMGPFLTAYRKVHDRSAEALRQAGQWMEPSAAISPMKASDQIPEVFDGDAPHRPGGCIAQAWSVAELLRVAAQDPGPRLLSKNDPVDRSEAGRGVPQFVSVTVDRALRGTRLSRPRTDGPDCRGDGLHPDRSP